MGRLILHVGTHKTGTTALQKFFDLNRAALAERGIFYPDYDIVGRDGHYAHIAMANAFAGQHDDLTRADARAFFAAVQARRADYDVTILSAEPFYRHLDLDPAARVPHDPEAYWPLRRAFIDRLAEELAPAEVVVVFRDQTDYAHSLYCEHVKATRYPHDLATFRRDFWWHFDYLGQARAWDAAFPGVRGLSYAHLCEGAGIETHFARAIGLNLPEDVLADLPRAGRQNPSMLPDMVLLKRLLHGSDLSRDAIRDRIAQLEARVRAEPGLTEAIGARLLYRGPRQRRTFELGYVEDNAVLARDFLHGIPEGAEALPWSRPDAVTWGEEPHPMLVDFLTARTLAAVDAPVSPP